jgi:nicotinamidase-related amidase
MTAHSSLKLPLQTQQLVQDSTGYHVWYKKVVTEEIPIRQSAVLICDMWDRHWSRGAQERGAKLAPQINRFVKICRDQGLRIIHSPSDTMDFYKEHAARKRILDKPVLDTPAPKHYADPPSPIDSSDGGSDTGETNPVWVWSRQTAAIEIDADRDVIAGDEGRLVYSYLKHNGITNLLYVGVHTNFCILNRSFGIKQMTRWGIRCLLVNDLTDSMYNPEMPPYVTHEQGTELVVEYIEKFWCPTVGSSDVLEAFT